MFLLSRWDSSGWAAWGLVRTRRLCFLCVGMDGAWGNMGWSFRRKGGGRTEVPGLIWLLDVFMYVLSPPLAQRRVAILSQRSRVISRSFSFFSRKLNVLFSCHIRTKQRRRDNGLYTMHFWVRRRGASSPRGDTMVRDSQLGRTQIITIPRSFLLITNERSSSSSSGAAVWRCVTLSDVSCALVE